MELVGFFTLILSLCENRTTRTFLNSDYDDDDDGGMACMNIYQMKKKLCVLKNV